MEDQEGKGAPAGEEQVELLAPSNKYEFVMAAAKEAERLNSLYSHRHEKPPKKVTELAVERVQGGLTRILYEEAESEEAPEQLPFFNPEI